ncbi:MAG: ABC transporter ATP-binding protein [Candidatus Hydrothermia bacterium]|jgi:ABC-type lipoprotein export system ATPase subunit|nr:ABC transporter ATP-binding protein [Candidatus Hydrothermia bacterium]
MIELINVKKVYKDPNEIVVFENLNLKISENEIVAIIGPSGSGKTTLLNLIGVIDFPDEGEILINSKNVKNLNENEISKLRNEFIGFIFQNSHLINELTVLENVLIPSLIKNKFLNGKDKKRALEILEYLSIANKKDNLPFEISGGERKRVEIARAIMNNPKIIIADEPTANLDQKLKFSIMEIFSKIRNDFKTTIVFSTHDYEILKYADNVYKIENMNLKRI